MLNTEPEPVGSLYKERLRATHQPRPATITVALTSPPATKRRHRCATVTSRPCESHQSHSSVAGIVTAIVSLLRRPSAVTTPASKAHRHIEIFAPVKATLSPAAHTAKRSAPKKSTAASLVIVEVTKVNCGLRVSARGTIHCINDV